MEKSPEPSVHISEFYPGRAHFEQADPLPDDGSLILNLFGTRIGFSGLSGDVLKAVYKQYEAFIVDGPPFHKVSIRRGAGFYVPLPPDRLMSTEIGSVPGGMTMLSNYFAAFRMPESGILLISDPERQESVVGAIENYIRWLVAETVVRRESIILHSAGIVREGKAVVFVGHSGAGKSTVAGLSAPYPVLSDDLVLLRRLKNTWHAYSTPFFGSYPQKMKVSGEYPIHGLYVLEKASRNEARLVSLPVAVAMILASAPFLAEEDRFDYLLPLVQDLCLKVPVFELLFVKNASFWDVIRD